MADTTSADVGGGEQIKREVESIKDDTGEEEGAFLHNDQVEDSEGSSSSNEMPEKSTETGQNCRRRHHILVTGLSVSTRACDLKLLFQKHGRIGRITLMINRSISDKQRFAHVCIHDDVEHFVSALDGIEFMGKRIRVSKAPENGSFGTSAVAAAAQISRNGEDRSGGRRSENGSSEVESSPQLETVSTPALEPARNDEGGTRHEDASRRSTSERNFSSDKIDQKERFSREDWAHWKIGRHQYRSTDVRGNGPRRDFSAGYRNRRLEYARNMSTSERHADETAVRRHERPPDLQITVVNRNKTDNMPHSRATDGRRFHQCRQTSDKTRSSFYCREEFRDDLRRSERVQHQGRKGEIERNSKLLYELKHLQQERENLQMERERINREKKELVHLERQRQKREMIERKKQELADLEREEAQDREIFEADRIDTEMRGSRSLLPSPQFSSSPKRKYNEKEHRRPGRYEGVEGQLARTVQRYSERYLQEGRGGESMQVEIARLSYKYDRQEPEAKGHSGSRKVRLVQVSQNRKDCWDSAGERYRDKVLERHRDCHSYGRESRFKDRGATYWSGEVDKSQSGSSSLLGCRDDVGRSAFHLESKVRNSPPVHPYKEYESGKSHFRNKRSTFSSSFSPAFAPRSSVPRRTPVRNVEAWDYSKLQAPTQNWINGRGSGFFEEGINLHGIREGSTMRPTPTANYAHTIWEPPSSVTSENVTQHKRDHTRGFQPYPRLGSFPR